MVEVAPGGISHKAGVRVNDRLVEINGESIEGLTHTEVVEKIVQAGQSLMFLLVDREADDYFKRRNIVPTAAEATIMYLPLKPRIAEMTKGPTGYGFLLKEDPVEGGTTLYNQSRTLLKRADCVDRTFQRLQVTSSVKLTGGARQMKPVCTTWTVWWPSTGERCAPTATSRWWIK